MPHDETPDRLSEALDRLAAGNGRDLADREPSNELIAAARFIQMLDRHDSEPEPDPQFLQRLEHRLMNPASSAQRNQPVDAALAAASLNGHARQATRPSRLWTPAGYAKRQHRSHWRGTPYFAAAAVLLLTLLAGLAAYRLVPSDGSGAKQTPSLPAPGMALPATPVITFNSDTGMYLGNAARTSVMPGPGPVGKPKTVWSQNVDVLSFGAPVVAGGKFFVFDDATGHGDDQLSAFDLHSGKPLWHAAIDNPTHRGLYAPATAGGLVYATTVQDLIAYSATDGKVVWQYTIDGATSTVTPTIADGLVFITASDWTVRAIDAKSGSEKWRATLPGAPPPDKNPGYNAMAVLVAADGLVYAENTQGLIIALDARDGHQRWTYQTEGYVIETPLVADGTLVVEGMLRGQPATPHTVRLYALDANGGKLKWGPITLKSDSTLAAGDGAVYVAPTTLENQAPLDAFELQTGKRRWTYQSGGMLRQPAYVAGELYVASSGDGTIRRLNTRTGIVDWAVYVDGGEPAIANGLVITRKGDTLVAIGGDGGTSSAAATPVDLSGRAACTPPRPAPTSPIGGTPIATLDAETKLLPRQGGTFVDGRPAPFTNWPQILAENVPSGPAASSQDAAGILQMLRNIGKCGSRPEARSQLPGFFTDDFFRRGIVPAGPNGYMIYWNDLSEAKLAQMQLEMLPDGRVMGVLLSPSGTSGYLLVFKQENGHWLIDEYYLIVPKYFSGPMG